MKLNTEQNRIPAPKEIVMEMIDNGPLYLEYQRLEEISKGIQWQKYDDYVHTLLEMISEKQSKILTNLMIH